MARPPQANAERTRERILSSASKLFSSKGLGSTSMREIARLAGVTQATVHHYFGSKDELHAAAVAAMYAELGALREQLTAMLGHGEDLNGLVEQAVRTSFRFAREHHGAVRMVFRNVINSGEAPQEHEHQVVPLLQDAAPMLARATNMSEARARFVLQTLIFTIVRYAISTPPELHAVATGKASRRKRHDPAVIAHIEDELVFAARQLLQLPGTPVAAGMLEEPLH